MQTAPIILFAYNRPDHCRRAVAALIRNPLAADSRLIVYCDGPRHPEDATAVQTVQQYVGRIDGFRHLDIIKRDTNLGLAKSIITGVTEVMRTYGRAIVLEDDLVVAPSFLQYMNSALQYYAHEEKVISIHAYTYPVDVKLPETFFLRGADCWGWATWQRGWDLFESNGARLQARIKDRGLWKDFDRGPFNFGRMLKHQVKGRIDSWAIRWHAAAYLAGRLTLYPGRSLVNNIGLDNSGTHCRHAEHFNAAVADNPVTIEKIELRENKVALKAFRKFIRSRTRWSFIDRFRRPRDRSTGSQDCD